MIIETNFNIGDKVNFTYEYTENKSKPCSNCNNGNVVAQVGGKPVEVDCPTCKGVGSYLLQEKKQATEIHEIVGIHCYDMNNEKVHYAFASRLAHEPSWNIFPESQCELVARNVNPTGQAGSSQWAICK